MIILYIIYAQSVFQIQLLKDQLLEKDEQLTTKYAYYRHEELRQLEEKKEVEGVGGGGEAATELAIQPSGIVFHMHINM
jgi:hypothetical protein